MLQSVTKCYKVLQSVTKCYKVLQSIAKYCKVLQSITMTNLAHLLKPIFGLVSFLSKTNKQIPKVRTIVSDDIDVFWLNIFKSKDGETEHTVKLVKFSNLLNKRVDDMTM